MWENFFGAGGWGMYPVMVLGFGLLASVALDALRRERGGATRVLGIMTVTAGLLGTCTGICNSAHYIGGVPHDKQLEILAYGVEESMHVIVLALLIVMIAGLIALVGAVRRRRSELAGVP